MKVQLSIILAMAILSFAQAQTSTDKALVEKACMDYLDGFYQGDTTKIINSIKPTLHKLGYWKNDASGKYALDGTMTFEQAKNYARRVAEKRNFADPNAPKKVEVLDVMNHIASAKVTAWWGTDYLLLSKEGKKWMIEQVLWEGPLQE